MPGRGRCCRENKKPLVERGLVLQEKLIRQLTARAPAAAPDADLRARRLRRGRSELPRVRWHSLRRRAADRSCARWRATAEPPAPDHQDELTGAHSRLLPPRHTVTSSFRWGGHRG